MTSCHPPVITYSSGQKNVAVSAAVHPVCTFAKQSTNGLQTQTSAVRSVPFRSVSFPAVVQQAQYCGMSASTTQALSKFMGRAT